MSSIKDVAKIAGVGIGTVSRVLNNSGSVKEETRLKIEKVIKELEYTPNEIARNFKRQDSKIIALIIPSIFHPFFSEIAYHVEVLLEQKGYKLMICNSDANANKEIDYINMLKQNKVSGVIALTYNDIDQHIDDSYPIISIDRHFINDVPCIASDNYAGGTLAASKLIEAGCKRLAYIGTYNKKIETEVKYRKDGFKDQCEKMKHACVLHLEQDPIVNLDSFINQFFDAFKDKVDGILCETDILAIHVIQKAQALGLHVPTDLSVVGFDGIAFLDYFSPKLSTIRQPVELLALEAVNGVIALINGDSIKKRVLIPIEYRKGDSVK